MIQKEIDALVTRIQGFTPEITLVDIERQGDIVIELNELKKTLKGGLTCINKVFDHASNHLCRTIADELASVTYRHPRATITASARGFFSIEDPHAFIKWYEKMFPGGDGLGKLMELVGNKKKTSEFFEMNVLEQGEPLPKFIKSHIIATCKIRSNANGKKEKGS